MKNFILCVLLVVQIFTNSFGFEDRGDYQFGAEQREIYSLKRKINEIFKKVEEPIDRNSSFCSNVNPCIGGRYDLGELNLPWRDGTFSNSITLNGTTFSTVVTSVNEASGPINLLGSTGDVIITEGPTGTFVFSTANQVAANCNGIADTTAVIQAALTAAANAGGGAVILPTGICVISSALQVGVNVTLKGQSMFTTYLYLASGSNSHMIQTAEDGVTGFSILDLALNGNAGGQNPSNASNCDCIYLQGGFFDLRNLNIQYCLGNGINSDASTATMHASYFERIWIRDTGMNGIYFASPSDTILVDVIVAGASKNANGTYSGVYMAKGGASAHFFGLHVFHDNGFHMAWCFYAVSTGHRLTNSDLEGCIGLAYIGGNYIQMDGMHFYNPASSAQMIVLAADNIQITNSLWTLGGYGYYPTPITIGPSLITTTSTAIMEGYIVEGVVNMDVADDVPVVTYIEDGGGNINIVMQQVDYHGTPFVFISGTPHITSAYRIVPPGFASISIIYDGLGFVTMPAISSTGSGYEVLVANTAVGNAAYGFKAGTAITTSPKNTIVGSNTGKALTTGTGENVIVGWEAGLVMATGSNNALNGYLSGQNIIKGTLNTAIGSSSGSGIINGTGNSFLGANTGANGDYNYCTGIGFQATCTSANQLVIGAASFIENTLSYGNAQFTAYAGSDTATFTLGNSSIVGAGSPSAACQTSHICDSASGTIQLVTGTGVTLAGSFLTVQTIATRTNQVNCVYNMYTTTGGQITNFYATMFTTGFIMVSSSALASSTTYHIGYWCGGI